MGLVGKWGGIVMMLMSNVCQISEFECKIICQVKKSVPDPVKFLFELSKKREDRGGQVHNNRQL
jgi:hypothetical protein